MIRIICALLLFALTMPASADWDFSKPHVQECNLSSALQVNECLGERDRNVDKRLNFAYQKLKKMTSGSDTVLLVSAQKAWLNFREEECKFFNPKEFNFNSYYVYEQMICEIDMNEKRIKDLERYLEWTGCGSCRW